MMDAKIQSLQDLSLALTASQVCMWGEDLLKTHYPLNI